MCVYYNTQCPLFQRIENSGLCGLIYIHGSDGPNIFHYDRAKIFVISGKN